MKYILHDILSAFSISFGDLIWPDLDLELYLVYDSYLHVTFFIHWEVYWQSLGQGLWKVTILIFGLTLSWLLIFF